MEISKPRKPIHIKHNYKKELQKEGKQHNRLKI